MCEEYVYMYFSCVFCDSKTAKSGKASSCLETDIKTETTWEVTLCMHVNHTTVEPRFNDRICQGDVKIISLNLDIVIPGFLV